MVKPGETKTSAKTTRAEREGLSQLEHALALPSGARFYRCALQVNPHGYSEQFRGSPQALDENAYIEVVLAKCVEMEIEAIALTDHGSSAAFEAFRSAAATHGITIFPGFELTSSEGIHVLCIYDPRTDASKLERWLGALEIHDAAPSSAPSILSFSAILGKVREQGGVTIAAHVTSASGLFTTLNGQACVKAWKDENLLAVQIPGSVEELPADRAWKQILRNQNADYRRQQPAAIDLAVAVVNASDVKAPADLEKPGSSCWIKMSELSVEGLRQAFLDPGSRIRLSNDDNWRKHAEIVAMTWEGGFLDGSAVHFNGNLNVLVGGRGTGKSTVLESLRYALAVEPMGDDARRQHDGVVRSVLGNGTKVTVSVCSYHPTQRDYRIERTVPNPPVVRDSHGSVLNLRPADVMPRAEIFGQHEIAELAKSPEKLTRLLERFVTQDPGTPERIVAAHRELERSRTQILNIRTQLQNVEERLAKLPAIEETLKKYQEVGIEAKLQEQALVVREERVLKTAVERMQPVRESLADLRRGTKIDLQFLSEKSLEALPAKTLLQELEPVLVSLSESIATASRTVEEALKRADNSVAEIRARWDLRKQAAQVEYERILRELQREKVDGGEFIRLQTQIEELRPLAEQRALYLRSELEARQRRSTLATEWEEVKGSEYRALEVAAKKVSSALRDRVRVRVEFAGNRKPLTDLLRESIGGVLAQTIKAMENDASLSIPELANLCRRPADDLAQRFSIPKAQAERLVAAGDEFAMRIEELRLIPTTLVGAQRCRRR